MTLHHEVRGDGPPVLLVHAGIADSRMWAPLAERLVEAGHTVVTCDLRGFGRTPIEAGVFSNAADLTALLDELGLDRVAVVGASYGGRVTLELAILAPERVAALVLLASSLDEFEASAERAAFDAEEQALYEADQLDAMVDLNVRTFVTRGGRAADPAVVELVRTMQRDAFVAQWDVEDADFEALDPPVARRLAEIAAPAIVLVGTDDLEDFHRVAAKLTAELPAVEPLVTIDGAAHLPALERPDDVAAVVVPFLRARCASP
jgi:3-oxoadipate enol-lactonase